MAKRPVYVLSGVKQGSKGGYMSEGLLELDVLLGGSPPSRGREFVVSSDVVGPTWFSSASSVPLLSTSLEKGKGGEVGALRAHLSSLDPRSKALHPQWILSELGGGLLTDFKSVREVPVLTILNAFEMAMRGVVYAAADLRSDSNTTGGRRLVDVSTKGSNQELVVGRLRRCTTLMCYTLIEALLWKEKMAITTRERLDSVPGDQLDYTGLAREIKKACDAFINGDELTATDDRRYALISPTTFVSMVASGVLSAPPIIKGAFYEAILGERFMIRLSRFVAAEYSGLLRRAETIKMPKGCLTVEGVSSTKLTENEAKWVEMEKIRRWKQSSTTSKTTKGVSVRGYLNENRDGMETGPVDSLYSRVEAIGGDPKRAVETIFNSNRQVLHANFDVSHNPYFYSLWNWLFLATGAFCGTLPNPTTRNILVNVLIKDMHASMRRLETRERS